MATPSLATCIACEGENQTYIDEIWDDRYGSPGKFSILKCSTCGQMVTSPMLSEQDLPALYSRYYPRGNADVAAIEREAELVLAPDAAKARHRNGTDNQGHYFVRPAQKVLDIGCGSCISLLEIRNLGGEAFGIETDPNVRAIADHFGLNVHIGSIHDNPFPGHDFDLIVLNQVIEHVPDPIALLKLVRSRLRPQGKVILGTPNSGSLNKMISGRKWLNWHIPYHLHHYNKASFKRIAEKAGYNVLSIQTVTPNLWTILQLRAYGDETVEGQPSTAWAGSGPSTRNPSPSVTARWKTRLASRAERISVETIAPFNRTVDALGLGDSMLVQLEPADDSSA
ncbi:class I SAM-dependent methyltransferase [Bradyrhizobium sp.]|uniref:class I SAM-dependent methyltransferase n=1 Tax=Bradyrhizobium sp. TaxID=376 RepID=UPI0026352EAA|nr:class I SAM-dependent methyltransferase [Bradyrhizobium sp.]